MSTIDNGGPAFPIPLNPGQPWLGMSLCDGMTLRDYFAAKAMGALLSTCDVSKSGYNYELECRAIQAYAMADAMLIARRT